MPSMLRESYRTRLPPLAAAFFAVVLVVNVAPAPVGAATSKKTAEKIRTLREQVEEASEEENALLGELDAIADRRRVLDADVATVDAQLRRSQAEFDSATARLDHLSAQLTVTQNRAQQVQSDLASARALLRRRAVAAYVHPAGGTRPALRAGRTMREVAATEGYMQALISAQRSVVARHDALRKQLDVLQGEVEANRQLALDQQNVVVSYRSDLEANRLEHEARRGEARSEEQRQAALVNRAREKKADFELQIAMLQAESESIGSFLRGIPVDGALGLALGRGVLGLPVPGRITSNFGSRVHPIFGDVRVHNGMDFAGASGTPIRAAAAGTVVHAGPRGGYGNTIIVDHGRGLATMYAHQSELLVTVGGRVERGQVIGRVGSTGFSTGPHLHFETRVNGTPVDPMSYL